MQVKVGDSILSVRHFSEKEFLRCSPSCTFDKMQPLFLYQLDQVRQYCGVVFVLNSAYRSPEYDKLKGRSGSGFHTKGRAVDVRCTDSASRMKIIAACKRFGLSCGIASNFIHIDNRSVEDGYSEPIAFLY